MKRDDNLYFENPGFQRILEQYENALEQGVGIYMDAEDLTDIAEYYMTHNEENKANACIRLALDLHPDAVDPQVFISRQHLFHGDIAAAYDVLNGIQNQEEREVAFLRCELLLKEKRIDEAVSMMEEVLASVEEDRDAFIYDTSDIFFENECYEESLMWALLLKREFPQYPDLHLLLADIYIKLSMYDDARRHAEEVIEKDSFNEGAWIIIAESYAIEERNEESLEAVEFLLAINEKHPEGMLTRASNLFYLNRIEEAHQQYQKYLTHYPDEYAVLYLDGICLANLEKYDEARTILLRAIELSNPDAPECIHIHMQLAYVFSKLHQLPEALDQLDHCMLYPQPEPPVDYDLARGHILLENDESEKAEECFNKAVETSKDPYETLLKMGISYGETGHYERAVKLFQSLHDSGMKNAKEKTSPYLAYCYLFLDNKDLFLKFLKEAAELNPNITQFLFSQYYPGLDVKDYYKASLLLYPGNSIKGKS